MQLQVFGDVLIATSILEALKQNIPHVKIYFLVYKPYDIVLYKHPFIDHILAVCKGKGWRYYINRVRTFIQINRLHFDLVIDLQNNPNTQIISFLSGAKYRIGWKRGQYAFFYNYKVLRGAEEMYQGDRAFNLISPLGISYQPYKYYFHIKEESHFYIDNWLKQMGLDIKGFVAMAPGSTARWKKWGAKYYATLGDMIWEKFGLIVVLLGAKNEYADCSSVYELMNHKPIIAPETDINQALALLSRAKLFVCNDCGLNHLTCATETPTIAIFGMSYQNTIHWSPVVVSRCHHHLYHPDFPKDAENSFGITPEEVVRKIREKNIL